MHWANIGDYMSILDFFATHAMDGMFANNRADELEMQEIVKHSYTVADKMMAERELVDLHFGGYVGITPLDFVAAHAMRGMFANKLAAKLTADQIVAHSWKAAKAMMEERKKHIN